MELQVFFEKYWPFLALVLWFAYKWWNSKRVVALLPGLRRNGAVFVDVRSAAEFASGNAPGSLFSPSGRDGRHIRLSGCHHFSDRYIHALLTLGELAKGQIDAG